MLAQGRPLTSHFRSVWGKPAAERVFGYHAWEGEMEQIIAATGFGAAPGHMKAAERMAANDGAGDGSVNIKGPDLETVPHLRTIIPPAGIEPAGQSKRGRIRHFDRLG